jgi:methanol metabolism-related c-type cytochrome
MIDRRIVAIALLGGAIGLATVTVAAEPPMVTTPEGAKTQEGAKFSDGKWQTPEGSPTYHIKSDGTVDWLTHSGFRRYHSECHVCHGPEGEGSTYAPPLIDSLRSMSHSEFVGVVASGRVVHKPGGGESVMPALGDNKNVMCYVDDIYVYLKARADGALGRGRPPKRDDKPKELDEFEKSCLAG